MKKGLLVSVLLALSLGACGNDVKQSSEPEAFDFTGSVSYYDFDYYIDNARGELENNCSSACESIDDEEVTESIWNFYNQENEYLDTIEDIYEASQALVNIKNHEIEYIRDYFGVILNNRIDEYATPILNSITIPAAIDELNKYVNTSKNLISSGILGFYGTYGEYFRFMWEFEPQVVYVVWSHGGRWDPDQPIGPDVSDFQQLISQLWDYANELDEQICYYVNLDFESFVNELIAQIEDCETIEEAEDIYENLRNDLCSFALGGLKTALCNYYRNFVDYVDQSISNERAKYEVVYHKEDECEIICDCRSIDEAIEEYEYTTQYYTNDIYRICKGDSKGVLGELFEHYFGQIGNNDAAKLEYVELYNEYIDKINNLDCEIDELEDSLENFLDDFNLVSTKFIADLTA